jgi:hypothetical protein
MCRADSSAASGDRRVGVLDLVVLLVARLEALQDLDGLGHRRLADVDALEPPGQRAVALERVAVVLERRRADAAQVAVGQRRLEHVGGVHRAARGGAGADDRVDLVDEQDRLGVLGQHLDHRLEALLEVAAEAGAGQDRGHVEREHPVVGQRGRHLLVVDAQGQALGQRGLADAGLADEQRVVLPPAAQHLDHPLELGGAADQRIDLALGGARRQVDAEALERVLDLLGVGLAVLLDAAGPRHHAGAGVDLRHAVADVVDDVEAGHALLLEQVHREAVALAVHRDQEVAAGHLRAAGALDVHRGALEHPLERQRLIRPRLLVLGQRLDRVGQELLELGAQLGHLAAALGDHVDRGRIVEHRQQQVLERQVLVAAAPGVGDGALERGGQVG